MEAVEANRQSRLALLAYEKTTALYDFADVFLPAYEARKLSLGMLDFEADKEEKYCDQLRYEINEGCIQENQHQLRSE